MASVQYNMNYITLAKIVKLMRNDDYDDEDVLEKVKMILESNNGYDMNYAVPSDTPVQYFKPELIGNTLLHFAVEKSIHPQLLDLLLSRGADITRKNNKGFTPICLAYSLWKGNKPFPGERLLSFQVISGITINFRCDDGVSHFHVACGTSHLTAAKFFLDSGAYVNDAVFANSSIMAKCTPLHFAITNQDEDMFYLLLEYGADCNFLNSAGISPMHLIIEKQLDFRNMNDKFARNENLLDLALKYNFDSSNRVDCIGLSYFHMYCTKRCHFEETKEILKKFLENGTNINAPVNHDSPICPGYTALHFAAHCNLQTVIFLLDKGASLLVQDTNGSTPLDLCLKVYKPMEVHYILKNQMFLGSIQFQNGAQLMDVFRELDNIDAFKHYLKDFDVNSIIPLDSPLWPGYTLLHLIVKVSRCRDFVKMCLKHNADLSIQDANKMTALHLACHSKEAEYIDILCTHAQGNVDHTLDPTDNSGLSYHHIACTISDCKDVHDFLGHRKNVNVQLQKDINFPRFNHQTRTREYPKMRAGSTPLHFAAANENVTLSHWLLYHGADPHIRDADGLTSIHRAFMAGNDLYLRRIWMLKMPQFNLEAPCGLSYFHIACYSGNFKAVETLLTQVPCINKPIGVEFQNCLERLPEDNVCLGDTPLTLAVKSRSAQTIDLLLQNGADVEAKNSAGLNSLHLALLSFANEQIDSKIPQSLVAAFEKKRAWPDEVGLTRIHIACALQDLDSIKRSLEAGETLDCKINSDSPIWPNKTPLQVLFIRQLFYPQGNEIYKLLLDHTTIINIKTAFHDCKRSQKNDETVFGETAFHNICEETDLEILEKFFQSGVDINAPTDYFSASNAGFTPAHYAVSYSSNEKVLESLLKHGADASIEDSDGNTPLHLLALPPKKLRLLEKMDLLLRSSKVTLITKNAFGQTIMDILLKSNDESDIDVLLHILELDIASKIDASAKINLVTKLAMKFSEEIFTKLIEYIPKINDVDSDGRNVMHNLVLSSSPYVDKCEREERIINLLLKSGCEVDLQDNEGKTPLHYSVLKRIYNYTRLFLSVGADVNVKDLRNKTAYAYCFDDEDETSYDDDYDDHVEDEWRDKNIRNYKSKIILEEHISKLKAAKLHLNSVNRMYVEEYFSSVSKKVSDDNRDLCKMENIKITDVVSLRDVFREEILYKFPTMHPQERRAIFAEHMDSDSIWQDFPDWLAIFRLQRRKALRRCKITKPTDTGTV